jgi:Zn-dependent peptidase ImmA (M78 family)
VNDDPSRVAEEQRALLGIELNSQLQWGDRYRAFKEWRAAVEKLGIFVYQFRMPVEEVRGFSLNEGGRPTIVLNRSDDVRARIFTLFHEYGHLLLGTGGICLPEARALLRKPSDSRDERFCNEFSGSLLVPEDALLHDSDARELARTSGVPDDARFTRLVERFQVNRQVLLLRLHAARMLSSEQAEAKWSNWELQSQEWKEGSQRRGGPAERRPQRCVREFGVRFPALVLEAQADGRLTMAEALDYLSIRIGERDEVADLVAGTG